MAANGKCCRNIDECVGKKTTLLQSFGCVQNPDFWVLGPNVQVKWSRQDVYFQSQ